MKSADLALIKLNANTRNPSTTCPFGIFKAESKILLYSIPSDICAVLKITFVFFMQNCLAAFSVYALFSGADFGLFLIRLTLNVLKRCITYFHELLELSLLQIIVKSVAMTSHI